MTSPNQPKEKILVLGGSIRASENNAGAIMDLTAASRDLDDYRERAARFTVGGKAMSNSEIMAGAVLLGAADWGAEVDYFPLIKLFPPKEQSVFDLKTVSDMYSLTRIDSLEIEPEKFRQLTKALAACDAVVLSTPVYFGDRSSVANKFLQLGSVHEMLHDKAFGMVSVGAKRNGGQETTDVFGLFEAVNQGALVVGNGPPTSQYGGTAIGGQKGHVLEDEWGLQSAWGTGNRSAQVAEILNQGRIQPLDQKVRIAILVTMDTRERMLKDYLEELTLQVNRELPWVEFELLEIIDHDIYRCLGCKTCPQNLNNPGVRPHCIIKDPTDYMETVRRTLNRADGAILAGLNILDSARLVFRYQVLTERMRFVRRNDFELTNLLMAGLSYQQTGATINPIHSLKSMVSFLRHNTIFHRPIEVLEHNGDIVRSGRDELAGFCRMALRMKSGKAKSRQAKPRYTHFGKVSGYKPEH